MSECCWNYLYFHLRGPSSGFYQLLHPSRRPIGDNKNLQGLDENEGAGLHRSVHKTSSLCSLTTVGGSKPGLSWHSFTHDHWLGIKVTTEGFSAPWQGNYGSFVNRTHAMCRMRYFLVVNSLLQILQAGFKCSVDRWVFRLKMVKKNKKLKSSMKVLKVRDNDKLLTHHFF